MIRLSFTKKKIILLIFVVLTSLVFLSQLSNYGDVKIRDNQIYFHKVFLNIAERYVEEVDLPELLNIAIESMVDHLDPYSEYIEKDAKSTLELITEGTYGGLGMEIGMRDGRITVISPIEDTPAERAGIRPGDIINKVDGKSIKGLSLDQVSKKLRGPVGSEVSIEIIRPGLNSPLTFTLKRAKIVLKDVSYYTFLEPGIAYVKLTGFTQKAPEEMIKAINDLKSQGKIDKFILDLRNNPGGLLYSAIKIANIFLPKGTVIVKTRGAHEKEREYAATSDPLLPDVPLVVLVDNGSASASEIVTGAIQDLDRGVVVGDTTYGKGLVQKIIPIDDLGEKQLKLTTAKYYTPSGRCIQKEDYKLKYKEVYHFSNTDSLLDHKWYKTKSGRKVWSNGGIVPDLPVSNKKFHPFLYQLWGKGTYFKFIVQFLTKHPEIRKNPSLISTEDLFSEFDEFLKKNHIFYESVEQKELKKILSKLEKRNDFTQNERKEIMDVLQKIKEKDKNIAQLLKNDLIWSLQLELATQLNNKKMRFELLEQNDMQLQKSIDVLKNREKYQLVLGKK